MSKLVEEIENHGWAELREDASGKEVSMRVLPWDDYVALTSAVDALMDGVGRIDEMALMMAAGELPDAAEPRVQHLRKISRLVRALPDELKEALE